MVSRGLLSLIITLIALLMLVLSLDFSPKPRMVPFVVSLLIFVMAGLQFVSDAFPAFTQRLTFLQKKGVFTDGGSQSSKEENGQEIEEEKGDWSQVWKSFIWLIGFTLLLYFTSYLIAVPVFLFLYTWLIGKGRVMVSLFISISMAGLMYILFGIILGTNY